ncbi:hypothetical protein GCM10009736_80080 [Actinomadura bangladeshensis]
MGSCAVRSSPFKSGHHYWQCGSGLKVPGPFVQIVKSGAEVTELAANVLKLGEQESELLAPLRCGLAGLLHVPGAAMTHD